MPRSIQRILFVYPETYLSSGGGIATYLHHAIRAHLEAGRDVHLVTWLTPSDPLYFKEIKQQAYAPLTAEKVTVVRLGEEIQTINPVGGRNKNVSDLLYPYVAKLEEVFQPDLIEGTDYLFPLHSYLERRRAGLHRSNVPIATFNHGLLNEIYPATALFPTEPAMRELACEIQVIRWSDFVLAPSDSAAARIREIRRKSEGIHIIREPFTVKEWIRHSHFDPSRFLYFGRVSFGKGVDIFAGMLTAINDHWPVSDVTFLGRRVEMPFRRSDAVEFINARLHPNLRDKVKMLDHVGREEISKIIDGAGFFGNFSRSETFSYTTLEALERGVVPLLLRDSPMAELLPPNLRDPGTFAEVPHRTTDICRILNFWTKDYSALMAEAQAFAAKLSSPSAYAAAYDAMIPAISNTKKPSIKPRYGGEDVTVLVCTHNDADLLRGALRSVFEQTVKVHEIIVLDDGTTEPEHIAMLDNFTREPFLRVIRVNNMGLVAGRNVLVESARTDFVIFLDADDRLAPTFVEKTLAAVNSDPDRWAAVITRRKNFGTNDHEMQFFLLDTPAHWIFNDLRMTALIRRETLEHIRFDPSIRNGEADDWWWWLNFTLHGYEATFVPESLFFYRTIPGSMSLPWSSGQAALTAELLKRCAATAASKEVDLAHAFQWVLGAAYMNKWDADQIQATHHASAEQKQAAVERAMQPIVTMVGRKRAGTLMLLGRRIVRSHPLLRRLAHATLQRLFPSPQSSGR